MKLEIHRGALLFVAIMALGSVRMVGWKHCVFASLLIAASVLAHELGHVVYAAHFGVRVKRIGFSLKGAYIARDRSQVRIEEFLITAAGPATNLFLFVAFLSIHAGNVSLWLAICNFALAVANLLPIGPSDGKRLIGLLAPLFSRPV